MSLTRLAASFSVFVVLVGAANACGSDSPGLGVDAGRAQESGARDGSAGGDDSAATDSSSLLDTGSTLDARAEAAIESGSDAGREGAADAADADDGGPQTRVVTVAPNGNFSFGPATLTIKVNDSVQWTWAQSGHTVTSGTAGVADDAFCSPSDTTPCNATNNPVSNAGAIYTHKFTTAGTFPFFCRPHAAAGMTGTITVQ